MACTHSTNDIDEGTYVPNVQEYDYEDASH